MRIDNQLLFFFSGKNFYALQNFLTDNITYTFSAVCIVSPPYLLQNVKKPCVKYDHFCV